MIIIAILAIPFIFYFQQSKIDLGARSRGIGNVYGRPVTDDQVARGSRMFMLARDLGMFDFLQDLTMGATSEQDAHVAFAMNLLILRHEADHLGIQATPAETADAVRNVRAFRGENGFDMKRYTEFVQNYLGASGLNEGHIEELATDQARLARIKKLLNTGIQISESESRENLDQAFSKYDVDIVRFRAADFIKDVKIADEDISKYFEAHKDQLKTEEKRKLDFIVLSLTEEQKKLTGKERVDALQKLADRANDVSQALLDKGANFQEVAAKMQTPIRTTGEFTRSKPDPQLTSDPQLADSAFQITTEQPNSDPIQVADGFYILHLAGVAVARPLAAEEAKPKIVEALQTQRTREMMALKAAELSHNLREMTKAGETLPVAVQKSGAKPEKIPAFSLMDEDAKAEGDPKEAKDKPPESPDLPRVKQAVAELKAGDVSDFIPTQEGGLVAIVENRMPVDPAQAGQKRAKLDEQYLKGKRGIVFYEWMRDRRRNAGIAETKRS